ncbi:hypothetical protein B0H34DRAFT_158261 [Crassisporium funariophilum]|nr:hypothetical protein B0H34DRAFT_158261 [Crassisporium funariophilum]
MKILLWFTIYTVKVLAFSCVHLLICFFFLYRTITFTRGQHLSTSTSFDTMDVQRDAADLSIPQTPSINGSNMSNPSSIKTTSRSVTPELISSSSASTAASSTATMSSIGSSASTGYFGLSDSPDLKGDMPADVDRITNSESASPIQIVIHRRTPSSVRVQRNENLADMESGMHASASASGVAFSPRVALAQRLSLLVEPDTPVRPRKRAALKNITNLVNTRSPVHPATTTVDLSSATEVRRDHDCVEDAQFLVYRTAEEFLPPLVSTPAFSNTTSVDSGGFGSSARFSDMFSPVTTGSTIPPPVPIFALPEALKLSSLTDSITRLSGGLVSTLAAKYQNAYPDDYDDDDCAVDEQYEWEEEMRSLEMRCSGIYTT